MSKARAFAGLAAGLLVMSVYTASDDVDKALCPDGYEVVAGVGCSRPKGDGLMEIVLSNGSKVTSHGPDLKEHIVEGPQPIAQTSSDAPHQCVESTEAHHRIIYTYPSDRASRYDTLSSTIRGNVDKLQFTINDEASRLGSSAKLKFLCASTGLERVTAIQTAVTAADTTFSSLLSDLQAKGYGSTLAKYLIYSDVPAAGSTACGQGTLTTDDRPVDDNANNIGPEYAVLWDCNVSFAHEWGHNHGAVQPGSPHFYLNNGGRHCYDERSVMCYGNSETDPTIQQICTDRNWFDCNNDDYFNTAPASGSYLATHWNIGFCTNKWIVYTVCAALPPPPTTTTTTTTLVAPGETANLRASRGLATRKTTTLTWDAPFTGGTPAGYHIYECKAVDVLLKPCNPVQVLSVSGPPVQRTTDTPMGYCWRVSAYNAAGEGPPSGLVCAA